MPCNTHEPETQTRNPDQNPRPEPQTRTPDQKPRPKTQTYQPTLVNHNQNLAIIYLIA